MDSQTWQGFSDLQDFACGWCRSREYLLSVSSVLYWPPSKSSPDAYLSSKVLSFLCALFCTLCTLLFLYHVGTVYKFLSLPLLDFELLGNKTSPYSDLYLPVPSLPFRKFCQINGGTGHRIIILEGILDKCREIWEDFLEDITFIIQPWRTTRISILKLHWVEHTKERDYPDQKKKKRQK